MTVAEIIAAVILWWASMGAAVIPANQVTWSWEPLDDACGTVYDDRPRHIVIDRKCWDRYDVATKCGLISHEYGHVIGRGHNPIDVNSIMFPEFRNPDACYRAPFYREPARKARTAKRKSRHKTI